MTYSECKDIMIKHGKREKSVFWATLFGSTIHQVHHFFNHNKDLKAKYLIPRYGRSDPIREIMEKEGKKLVDVSILSHSVDVEYKVQEIEVKLTGTMGAQGIQGPQGIQGIQGEQGLQGIQGESWQEQFETVSKNLKSWNASFNYTLGSLTSIVYTDGTNTITKTFNYTGSNLTSIVVATLRAVLT